MPEIVEIDGDEPHPDAAYGLLIEYDDGGHIVCISGDIPAALTGMTAAGLRSLADQVDAMCPAILN